MDLIDAARRIVEESGTYTGGPIQYFEQAGRNTFVTALKNGLLPDHKLLDFGAGCLRLGYWFMRFLEPGNYYAMEPEKKMVDAGLNHLFDKSLLEYKKPTVRISDKCDMSAFGTDFDFVIARSILTHTTPGMLGKIFSEFSICAAPGAKFLASYWAASGPNKCRLEGLVGDDLPIDDWRFEKVVKFSLEYLVDFARRHDLRLEEYHSEDKLLNKQIWLKITRLD